MPIIDLSPAVHAHTTHWPGDRGFELVKRWSIEAGDSVNVASVSTTTHIGAHIDAPLHVIEGAPAVDQTPLDACVGPCWVLDVSHLAARRKRTLAPVAASEVRELLEHQSTGPVARLLLRHAWEPSSDAHADLPGIDPQFVGWFADQGGRLLGTDLASFDSARSTEMPAHRAAIAGGVVMLEGLDLSRAPEGGSELIALPVRWAGADAAPVRAVLRTP